MTHLEPRLAPLVPLVTKAAESLAAWAGDADGRALRKLQGEIRELERRDNVIALRQVHELAAVWPISVLKDRRSLCNRLRPIVMRDPKRETLVGLVLVRGLVKVFILATGARDSVVLRKDLLRKLLLRVGASGLGLAHNHRRSVEPSREDDEMRHAVLEKLCGELRIAPIDFIILTSSEAASFVTGRTYRSRS